MIFFNLKLALPSAAGDNFKSPKREGWVGYADIFRGRVETGDTGDEQWWVYGAIDDDSDDDDGFRYFYYCGRISWRLARALRCG